MDQDSFRQMLKGSGRASSSSTLGTSSGSRAKLAMPQKQKAVETSKPVFKPRKVAKQQDSKYRDRAAERRDGQGNDYAHVEAILDDFEKKHANEDRDKIEAQRKYLGGDSDHSVLVKGLDFSLLEQERVKASRISKDDLDELDKAFQEGSSYLDEESAAPKKRTRAELIQELKQKRSEAKELPASNEDKTEALDDVKQQGKFKPIGFKPIGPSGKKRKEGGGEEKKKKKKRKVEETPSNSTTALSQPEATPSAPITTAATTSMTPIDPQRDLELPDEDFDIFAGAGDYIGIDDEEEEEEEEHKSGTDRAKPSQNSKVGLEEGEEPSSAPSRRWFDDDEKPEPTLPSKPALNLIRHPEQPVAATAGPQVDNDDEMEDAQPPRLAGLESSTVPSIKDLLAMDDAVAKYEKKQKKKEKKKKKAKGGDDDDD